MQIFRIFTYLKPLDAFVVLYWLFGMVLIISLSSWTPDFLDTLESEHNQSNILLEMQNKEYYESE